MKRVKWILLFLAAAACFFYYDVKRYYVGRSFFDYYLLPMNSNTFAARWGPKYKRYFYFIYNDYAGIIFGCHSRAYKKSDFQRHGYDATDYFVVGDIVGYYYNDRRLIIVCLDEKNSVRWVRPYFYKDDILFLEISKPDKAELFKLKYVDTSDV